METTFGLEICVDFGIRPVEHQRRRKDHTRGARLTLR
jgi:hypothetical protein